MKIPETLEEIIDRVNTDMRHNALILDVGDSEDPIKDTMFYWQDKGHLPDESKIIEI